MYQSASPLIVACVLTVGACGGGSGDAEEAPRPAPTETTSMPTPAPAPGPEMAPEMTPAPEETVSSPDDDEPTDAADIGDGATDCAATLPCTRTSEDGTVTVELTAAQGEQADGSGDFRIDFAITATRALELGLDRMTSLAVGDTLLGAALVRIGDESSGFGDGTSAALPAAEPVTGSVEFLGRLPEDVAVLELVTLTFSTDDAALDTRFVAVPAGSAVAPVDCGGALPCFFFFCTP